MLGLLFQVIATLRYACLSQTTTQAPQPSLTAIVEHSTDSVFPRFSRLVHQVQENVFSCILRVLDDLDQKNAEAEILPMLLQAQLSHPNIRISAASEHFSSSSQI